MAIVTALIVAVAFCVESIFGFGGVLLALAGLAFVVPPAHLTVLGSLMALSAGLCILLTAYKAVDWQQLRRLLLLTLPGVVLGTLLLGAFTPMWLLKAFALMLIICGCHAILWPKARLPERWTKPVVALGGLMLGVFAVGGPFIALGWRDRFVSPQVFRATLAMLFCLTNCWRLVQLGVSGQLDSGIFIGYSWLIGVIFIAVWIGYYVHLRLSAEAFRRGMSALLLLAGVVLLFR